MSAKDDQVDASTNPREDTDDGAPSEETKIRQVFGRQRYVPLMSLEILR
jgi:hypothetical protein